MRVKGREREIYIFTKRSFNTKYWKDFNARTTQMNNRTHTLLFFDIFYGNKTNNILSKKKLT